MRIEKPLNSIKNIFFALITFLTVGAAILGFLLFHGDNVTSRLYYVPSITTVLAAICAVFGWYFASQVSYKNTKATCAISVMGNRFGNSEFSKHATNVNFKFNNIEINKELVDKWKYSSDEKEREAVQSLTYLANYFEFLAACVASGEIDVNFVEIVMGGNVKYYHKKFSVYIAELQRENPLTLKNFDDLYRLFSCPPRNKRK